MIELKDVHSYYDVGAKSLLYRLLSERPANANISHARMPSWEEHVRFVDSKPYRAWFVINIDLPPGGFDLRFGWCAVGAIYATNRNEIGVAILKEFHRRGFARMAITKLLAELAPLEGVLSSRPGRFVANVAPTNQASRSLFESVGGKLLQVTYEL